MTGRESPMLAGKSAAELVFLSGAGDVGSGSGYSPDLGFRVRAGDGERVTRIELALSAWEADVLPLNYTRADGLKDPV
jgi:hypothetical protein